MCIYLDNVRPVRRSIIPTPTPKPKLTGVRACEVGASVDGHHVRLRSAHIQDHSRVKPGAEQRTSRPGAEVKGGHLSVFVSCQQQQLFHRVVKRTASKTARAPQERGATWGGAVKCFLPLSDLALELRVSFSLSEHELLHPPCPVCTPPPIRPSPLSQMC